MVMPITAVVVNRSTAKALAACVSAVNLAVSICLFYGTAQFKRSSCQENVPLERPLQ